MSAFEVEVGWGENSHGGSGLRRRWPKGREEEEKDNSGRKKVEGRKNSETCQGVLKYFRFTTNSIIFLNKENISELLKYCLENLFGKTLKLGEFHTAEGGGDKKTKKMRICGGRREEGRKSDTLRPRRLRVVVFLRSKPDPTFPLFHPFSPPLRASNHFFEGGKEEQKSLKWLMGKIEILAGNSVTSNMGAFEEQAQAGGNFMCRRNIGF